MNTRSPYSQYDEGNKQTGRSPQSPRESTSTQTYTTKKDTSSRIKEDRDVAMEDRGRTRSRHNPDNDRSSDVDKNSDSYFSDDDDNTTYGSDRSPTPSSKSRSPHAKKTVHKMRSITPVQNRGVRKVGSKFPSSKKGPRWGFRSQSLNKESSPKDIDLVTKRVLSARLLKINELRNELTELQIKLDEFQKENKILKRLQFRQEKALNKFEDTENEISQLISRHNNEIRTLREHLRKSQERERNTEKRLKDAEDELYKANVTLKKLKQLSENRHLAEREELTKKLDLIESKVEDRERRVKDLEKNLELTHSSFQRQLLSEKKKAHDAQEEHKLLQDEHQKLTQKLKEKERELDAKNIYAYRLSKPSPKKDTEITPRKKVTNQSISTKSVQTNESASPVEFPSPPPPLLLTDEMKETQQEVLLRMEQDNRGKPLREEAEKHKKEKERLERKREKEEKQRREGEQKALEDKARKLRDEWEKEEFERKRKEDLFFQDTQENVNTIEDERLKRELLLAKMNEIDKENQDAFYLISSGLGPFSQIPLLDPLIKPDSAEKKHKTYKSSESTQKLFNGLPVHGDNEFSLKAEAQSRRNQMAMDSTGDFTFGSYAPSFGKGRSSANGQKNDVLEEPFVISNSQLTIQKDKKSNLMEQLFGSGTNTTLPSISKSNDLSGFASRNAKADHDSSNIPPWDKSSKVKVKDDPFFSGNGKNTNSNRHRSQPTPGRPVVKAVDSLEDEIEEVVL